MEDTELVRRSPFINTYGGLDLVKSDDGRFLRMGDCYGPDLFGPLSDEQVAAFHTLCEAALSTEI